MKLLRWQGLFFLQNIGGTEGTLGFLKSVKVKVAAVKAVRFAPGRAAAANKKRGGRNFMEDIKNTPDWEAIKIEYVTENISYEKLANKHEVPYSTLIKRAYRERWTQEREKYRQEVVKKIYCIIRKESMQS